MRTTLVLVPVLFGAVASACAAPIDADAVGTRDDQAISDVVSMTRRSDGKLDVVCKGKGGAPSYTQVVTDAELAAGNVCVRRTDALPETNGALVKNVSSPFADPSRYYYALRDLDMLRRLGAIDDQDEALVVRLQALAGRPASRVLALETLLAADAPSAFTTLLPAERTRLARLWKLFAVAAGPVRKIAWTSPSVSERLTDPDPARLEGRAPLPFSTFPASARAALARAAQLGNAPANTIRWESIHVALVSPAAFTDAERAVLLGALDVATAKLAPSVPLHEIAFARATTDVADVTVSGMRVTARAEPYFRIDRHPSFGCSASVGVKPAYAARVPAGKTLVFESASPPWATTLGTPAHPGPASPLLRPAGFDGNKGSGLAVFEAWSGGRIEAQGLVDQDLDDPGVAVKSDCAHLVAVNGEREAEVEAGTPYALPVPPGRYLLELAGGSGRVAGHVEVFTHRLARLSVQGARSTFFAVSDFGAVARLDGTTLCSSGFHVRATLGGYSDDPRRLTLQCTDGVGTNATPFTGSLDPAKRL